MKELRDTVKKLKNELKKEYGTLKTCIKDAISKYQEKASWSNLAAMLASIATLEAYRSIGAAIAEYQGKEAIYIASYIFTVVIIVIALWEFFCLISDAHVENFGSAVCRNIRKIWQHFKGCSPMVKWGLLAGIITITIIAPIAWKFLYYDKCITGYYSMIVEIYGIPNGAGDPLTPEERAGRAGYWKIDDYPNRHRVVVTYVDSYQQMEILRQYSSAYDMQVFQTPARIEYTYEKNSDSFKSYGQEGFLTAKENGYREPLTVSYYGSNGKLLLELDRSDDDTFRMGNYSSEDAPQLLNSTLLRIPDGQTAGNGLASQQIETTYNPDGLPAMRRLSQGTCNLYGVNGERYTYDRDGKLTSLCYLDGDGGPMCNKIGVMLITFKYDNADNLLSIRYYSDEDGTEKTEGFYGVFCEKFSYDTSNNLTERRQLDRTENWSYDTNGVYRYEYKYDGNTLKEEFYWGLNEISVWNKSSNSHSVHFEAGQEKGKEIFSVLFDTSSTPTANIDSPWVTAISFRANMPVRDRTVWEGMPGAQEENTGGISNRPAGLDSDISESHNGQTEPEDKSRTSRKYASIQYIFNNKTLEMWYCGKDGQPVTNEQGYAMKKIDYDNEMRIILESYANVNGEPCYIEGGYAAVRKTYGSYGDGREAWLEYLDIQGNITFNTEVGYACVEYEYTPQDRGEKITRIFYDAHRIPCRISDKGYAVIEELYNENGFLIQTLYKNEEGAVTCRHDYMVAEILYEYADDGNLIRERYKDMDGQPVNRVDTGYAVVYQEFEDGRLVQEHYEGYVDHVLCAVPDRTTGISIITYHYEKGEKQEESYFDTEGNPALRRDTGCASIQYEYDNNGQLLAEHYFGTDDKLILRIDTGCAIVRFGYDKEGRRTSYRYYGVDEKPVVNTKYHCAGMDYIYGERGYQSEIRYIGLDGSSLMNRDDYGIARICQEYDDFGNLSGESYYDEQEHPVIRKDCGYASYKDIYERGYLIERRYFDTERKPVLCRDGGYAIIKYEYDDYGKCISICYYGENGLPIISNQDHCAAVKYHYDERGNRDDIYYQGLDGSPMNRTDYGIAHIHRIYDDSGNIVAAYYYDAEGLPAVRRDYGYASYESTYEDGYRVESRYFGTDGSLILRKDTGYAVVKIAYDEYGQTLSVHYYGVDEEPVIYATYCCAGFESDYDQMGNQTEIRYIGLDGNLMNRRDCGVARVCYEYDAFGNLIYRQYFDTENLPAVWREYGYASYKGIYDNKFLVESCYFDPDGNPVLRKDVGYAVIRTEYNQNGQKEAEYYYDTFGEPVVSTKYYCAGMKYAYDKQGNLESIHYLGLDGEAMNRDDYGFATWCKIYDEFGNLTKEAFYDAEGNPAIRKDYGYASYSRTYVNGNIIETRYYDTDDSLALRKDTGYAIIRSNYDECNREISCSYYGKNEEPVIGTYYQCAGFEYVYDEKNNQTEVRYTGLDGELMNRRDCGVASVYKEYDPFGNLMGEAYYDADGYPTVWGEYGYASYKSVYENGKWMESRYFDLNGNLILRKDTGYAIIKLEYDSYGQRTAESYYGIDGQPVIHETFYCAGIGNIYDEKGNQIETYYWGLDEELINKKDSGIAKICREYDSLGRQTGESYFNAAEQPVIRKDYGYTSYRIIYENGKVAEYQYFDAGGNLVLRKDTGYAVIKYQYDNIGRNNACSFHYETASETVISTKYGCAALEYTYDEKGNMTKIQYIGQNGGLMNRTGYGIAQIEQEYDKYGNLLVESHYDTEGQLSLRADYGYAVCQKKYEDGKVTERRYLDTDGNLVLRQDLGYAMVRYGYNEYGQKAWEQYYGADGEPIISAVHHCAGFFYDYDDRGKQTMIWYMGTEGRPLTREDTGADLEYWEYDQYGSLAWNAFYTYDDGNYYLVIPKDRDYAGMEYSYDENENWISQRYFDDRDETVLCSETGYAVYERRYNDMGQLVAEIYYDENGEFINSTKGYAMVEYVYDASGNTVDWKYYDRDEVVERLESM